MKYLLDANTYIEAKNRYYNMDFCPAYWDWLDNRAADKVIGSIDLIKTELTDGDDELSVWVNARNSHFIGCDDEQTQTNFSEIANYVNNHTVYSQSEKHRFLDKGDPWLIAKAMSTDSIIVTQEVEAPKQSKKVKIPNICNEFNVEFINPFELLTELKPKFILSK